MMKDGLNILENFMGISLAQTEQVRLLNRVDQKFMIPAVQLCQILKQLESDYFVMEINGKRTCQYQTLYYDTSALKLYLDHQNGRANRFKVRFRKYVETNTSFFEIKQKTNKGRTIKTRFEEKTEPQSYLNETEKAFLANIKIGSPEKLQAHLWVNYDRITLVHKNLTDRVTIDLNLKFESFETKVSTLQFTHLCIIEIKQEKAVASLVSNLLKCLGHKPLSISKYCLGIATTQPHIKNNLFKFRINQIKRLQCI